MEKLSRTRARSADSFSDCENSETKQFGTSVLNASSKVVIVDQIADELSNSSAHRQKQLRAQQKRRDYQK